MEKGPIEVSYFSALILSIVEVDVRRLTWLMIGLFFLIQAFSWEFKVFFYGVSFIHWVDIALLAGLTVFYMYYVHLIGTEYVGDFEDNIPDAFTGVEPDSDNKIDLSVDMQGVESLVAQLYNEADVPVETIVASLASILGATMLAAGSNAATVDRENMEIQIVVKDVSEDKQNDNN